MKNTTGTNHNSTAINELHSQALVEGTSQATIGILITLAALVGMWGIACLASAITRLGAMEMARGFVTAVTGI